MREPKKIKLPRFALREKIQKHKKAFLVILSIIILLLGGGTTYLILSHQAKSVSNATVTEKTQAEAEPEPIHYYSPLTGLEVADEASKTMPVTGVMIENSPDARPQSGLKNSGIVFEAIAEGGITRFLVLYQQEKPSLIGPVRSLRLYDIDWFAAFDASIAHVGGSYYALQEVRNGSYRDIDQFFNSSYYWRSSDRYAPHNVYTSSEKLDALNASKGYTSSNFTGFTRTDASPSEVTNATSIDITISSYLYNSHYDYDASTNTYLRSQAGEAHQDREDGQITPKVVIAMRVDEITVYEDGYRQKITTIGSGSAVIFQNGTVTNATWAKTSKTSQITFTDANGNDVPLVRGQTWIAAVPNDGGDVSWQ